MKFGIPISLFLHVMMLSGGAFLIGAPLPLDTERLIIPIDIIAVAEQTNVKAAVKRPEPKPEPIPEPQPEPEPED